MSIAEQLIIAREKSGMTRAELAKEVGWMRLQTITDIEAGRELPSCKKLIRLAAALNTTFTIGETE